MWNIPSTTFTRGPFSSAPHGYFEKRTIKPLKLWIKFIDGSVEAYEVPSRDIQKTLREYKQYGVRRLIEVT
jgi:hypothetical protein